MVYLGKEKRPLQMAQLRLQKSSLQSLISPNVRIECKAQYAIQEKRPKYMVTQLCKFPKQKDPHVGT